MFSIYEILPEILKLWGENMVAEVEAKKNCLKFIEVLLRSFLFVFHIIIGFFRPDIKNKPDGQQVKVGYGNANLYAPQEI